MESNEWWKNGKNFRKGSFLKTLSLFISGREDLTMSRESGRHASSIAAGSASPVTIGFPGRHAA